MNRIMRTAAAVLLSLGMLAQPVLAAESPVRVILQGAPVQFEVGAEPIVENDRTLVPLRALTEKLGFMVEWESETQQITLTKFPTKVILWVDKLEAQVNGKPVELAVAPKMVDGRVFVPVRFISEQLGAHVFWDGDKNEIRITPKGQSDPAALALFKAEPPTAEAANQNMQMQANLSMTIAEPGLEVQEITMTMNLHAQGQEMFGDVTMMAPFMGVNLPMLSMDMAARNGHTWIKFKGGLLGQSMAKEMPGWQSMSALTGTGLTPPVVGDQTSKFTPEELQKIGQKLIDQMVVTFGPSVVKDGKSLTRLDVDLSKVDFFGFLGELIGEAPPADLGLRFENFKASLLVEADSLTLRSVEFTVRITDGKMSVDAKLDATINAATTPIAWPEDLPTEPPADQPSLLDPFFPAPLPGGNA